ncbi:glycine--tRNA ligase beta subunit [Alphaproteobacteria bacterium]|nr:glycine--tRNA ligase beta subunit [Alphaproteobacteria bacterium]
MSDFILEIFSEEIPAKMQKNAIEAFHKIAQEQFLKNHLIFRDDQLECFITPTRMVLSLKGIDKFQKTQTVKKIGPKIDANPKAIGGFLKSLGLANINQLQQENGFYVYQLEAKEIRTADLIKDSLPIILQKTQNHWPKIMRWDVEGNVLQFKWIRPIRNILSIFDQEVIDIEFAGLKSNNQIFLGYKNNLTVIKNVQEYYEVIEKNKILLNHNQRREIIFNKFKNIKAKLNIEIIHDEANSFLMDEVVGLCDMPEVLIGSIEKKFLELPDEILIQTLQSNQRFFCCRNIDGSLSTVFLFVINKKNDESCYKKIISDNEKLVKARLCDAEFFVKEDLKRNIQSRVDDLKKIIFHQELGSIYDKTQRINSLAKFIAIFVPHCDLNLIEQASELSKVDLTSKAVAELPELQGKIGSYYALKQNYDGKIAMAIYEHYLPIGNSELPKTALGITLSLADKIDSVVGFFLANEKPTSSKDPYALRRGVLGIIRIAIKYDLALPIRILIEKSLNCYPLKLQKKFLASQELNFYKNKKQLIEEIAIFLVERLRVYLKDQEAIRVDVLNVVVDEYVSNIEIHKFVDLIFLTKKIKFLNNFVNNPANKNIIELYKRSSNIIEIEEKKDNCKYSGKPSILGLKSNSEKILNQRVKQIFHEFDDLIGKAEFEKALALTKVLELPLANFFEKVIVNDQDKSLRENRLLLLSRIRFLFNKIGDFSKINL